MAPSGALAYPPAIPRDARKRETFVADEVQPLLVAAALSRTLVRVLDEVEDDAVDDGLRAAATRVADSLEAALEARRADD